MHRDRTLACELAAEAIPLLATGTARAVPTKITDHIATCLRCQAELARYRGTARALRGLRADRLAPPAGAVTATIAALHAEPEARGPEGRGIVHVSGGVVVTAAGAAASVAGMLVWRQRRRALAG